MAVIPHPTKSRREPGRWWYVDIGRGKERQRILFEGPYDDAVRLYQELATTGRKQDALLPKLGEMIVPFLDWYKHESAATTWVDVRNAFSRYLVPRLGRMRPDQLGQTVLDKFRDDLLADGMSPRTFNKLLSYMGSLLRWGENTGRCKPIPGRLPRYPRRKLATPPKEVLTEEQIDAMYAAMDEKYRVLFLLMADHGLRKSEALHIRIEDIDRKHKMLTVLGKGHKYRSVPFMSRRFEEELDAALERVGRKRGVLVVNPDTGKPYYNIRKALLRAGKIAGVPEELIGHHILRHTFATSMAEHGLPPYALQRLLGHESQATTDKIYVHIGGDAVAEAARSLRASLSR